jgi:hypothetical protein
VFSPDGLPFNLYKIPRLSKNREGELVIHATVHDCHSFSQWINAEGTESFDLFAAKFRIKQIVEFNNDFASSLVAPIHVNPIFPSAFKSLNR